MTTRAATFYPSAVDDDVAASEIDVRKLSESLGGADNSTQAAFGAGTAEIVLRPYVTNSSTGTSTAAAFGWLLNRDGVDGMAVPDVPVGFDGAVRFVPAGTWTFNGRLGAAIATTGSYRLRVRVYRVGAGNARTLLFGPVSTDAVTPPATGASVSVQTVQPEYTFAQDETFQVGYSIEKTAGSVSSETVQFRLNDTLGNDCEVLLPGGIRTRYTESEQVSGAGTALLGALQAGLERDVTATASAAFSRTVTASRTVQVTASGTTARANVVALGTITTNVTGDVQGRIQIPLDEIPGGGDFEGADPAAAIAGTVFDRSGAAAVGATVLLFRQSDNLFIASTLSDAAGAYTFTRDTADPNTYYVMAFTGDEDHGTSNRSLTPEV